MINSLIHQYYKVKNLIRALVKHLHERHRKRKNRKDTYILYISSKVNISALINLCENSFLNKLEGNKLNQFNN